MTTVTDDEVSLVVLERAQQLFTTGDAPPPAVVEPRTSVTAVEKERPVLVEQPSTQVHLIAVGPQGPAGSGATGGATIETYIAATPIGGHRVVVTNEDGEAVYADNRTAAHANMATKLSLGAADAGAEVEVQLVGRITEGSFAWTPQASLYVGQNGQLTDTPPASPAVFSKVVAVAETATTILLVQEPPVMLA